MGYEDFEFIMVMILKNVQQDYKNPIEKIKSWIQYKNHLWLFIKFEDIDYYNSISITPSQQELQCHFEKIVASLCCAREFSNDNFFDKDYLPLDMFRLIVKSINIDLKKLMIDNNVDQVKYYVKKSRIKIFYQ